MLQSVIAVDQESNFFRSCSSAERYGWSVSDCNVVELSSVTSVAVVPALVDAAKVAVAATVCFRLL